MINENEKITTIRQVADVVFSVFPEAKLRKYDRNFGGKTLTLRDLFVVHFTNEGAKPRQSINRYFLEKTTLRIILNGEFLLEENPDFTPFNVFFG